MVILAASWGCRATVHAHADKRARPPRPRGWGSQPHGGTVMVMAVEGKPSAEQRARPPYTDVAPLVSPLHEESRSRRPRRTARGLREPQRCVSSR